MAVVNLRKCSIWICLQFLNVCPCGCGMFFIYAREPEEMDL